MEKKTIGGFISALRKANGMTQKDLAERLNVSDKSVSRWECDEGAPDLSLIPVIAEIFDVSCDEILRGERKSLEQREDPMSKTFPSPKAEKQCQLILKSAMSRYKTCSYISMGVSVGGLIAALICNIAFSRASLGFLVGAVFFAASIVCQFVSLNRAMFSADEEEFQSMSDLKVFKRKVIRLTQISVGLTVLLIGFILPLVLADAYLELNADRMLFYGMIGMAVAFAAYAVILWFLNARLFKKHMYLLTDKEIQVYRYNRKLQKVLAIVFASVVAATAIAHEISTSMSAFIEKITFYDYDSFVNFIEIENPSFYDVYNDNYYGRSKKESVEDEIIYKDVYGNEISEDEYRSHKLVDKDWNVLCEYMFRNDLVTQIEYGSDSDMLPITVSWYNDYGPGTIPERHMIFGIVYAAETIGILLVYFIKRKKSD